MYCWQFAHTTKFDRFACVELIFASYKLDAMQGTMHCLRYQGLSKGLE